MDSDSLFFCKNVVVFDEFFIINAELFKATAETGAPVEEILYFHFNKSETYNSDEEMENQNCGVAFKIVPVPNISWNSARNYNASVGG